MTLVSISSSQYFWGYFVSLTYFQLGVLCWQIILFWGYYVITRFIWEFYFVMIFFRRSNDYPIFLKPIIVFENQSFFIDWHYCISIKPQRKTYTYIDRYLILALKIRIRRLSYEKIFPCINKIFRLSAIKIIFYELNHEESRKPCRKT